LTLFRELDELEREDFTRLKKVQSNKADQLKREELERKRLLAEAAESGIKILSYIREQGSPPISIYNMYNIYRKNCFDHFFLSNQYFKGKEISSPSTAENALSGFDAADDEDVVFK
jgi:hypothetical protein